MPFLHIMTNVHIGSAEKELKKQIAEAIQVIPGKTESVLMIQMDEDQRMYMAGEDQPAAMLELKVKGHYEDQYYEAFNQKITAILREELGIRPARVYLEVSENDIWGVGGAIIR